MSVDYNIIGKHIQDIRKSKAITQETLAELLNVSVGYISQIERGISKPNLNMLADICSALNCDLSSLLFGSTTDHPNYLIDDFARKFKTLSPAERNIVLSLIDALIRNRDGS